ncbi:DUF1365 domain-containing protein [Methylobacillus methanolivorans]|uniref:DUF1365 domain-containing protein n=1 Tax=Methylobacillus methanolivorans TaxID=1848927 RepID=A0ABW8GP53_9PROT
MTEIADMELGLGKVMHTRTRPLPNHFVYPVFCLRIPLRQLSNLRARQSWIFAVNRWRLLSFHERDHGDCQGDLLGWLERQLESAGIVMPAGEIWLQAMPRVLGYVFNPVSFWYLHNEDGTLRAILAEVNNTFGEHHQYLLVAEDNGPIVADTVLECRKAFHVSPFCNVSGYYQFKYSASGHRHHMAINYFDHESSHTPLIATSINCHVGPATTGAMFSAFCQMPLMTLGVVFRIHWQALRLWLKKTPFHSKPTAPEQSLTYNQRKHGNEKQV